MQLLWTFCNPLLHEDSENTLDSVDISEFNNCISKFTDFTSKRWLSNSHLDRPQRQENFLRNFQAKYWNVIDQDGSGGFSN